MTFHIALPVLGLAVLLLLSALGSRRFCPGRIFLALCVLPYAVVGSAAPVMKPKRVPKVMTIRTATLGEPSRGEVKGVEGGASSARVVVGLPGGAALAAVPGGVPLPIRGENKAGFVSGGGQQAILPPVSSKRFAFVLDHSGSMRGVRLDAAKKHVAAELTRLKDEPGIRFQVFLFDDTSKALHCSGGNPQWVELQAKAEWIELTPDSLKAALAGVAQVDAAGGTVPLPALRGAFALPGVEEVFFLTDAENISFTAEELANLEALAPDSVPTVHATLILDKGKTEPADNAAGVIAKHFVGVYTKVED